MLGHELVVLAFFHQLPLFEHHQTVGTVQGGESSARWISCSVSVSTDEVASSRMRMRGLMSKARAIEMRWRSPPDSPCPRSPTSES